MVTLLSKEMKTRMRVPYALRRLPEERLACLLPCPKKPQLGDIALARLEQIGKNRRLELVNGRAATLHEGDLLAVVYGNRYATQQFEGHAAANGIFCDLLSMGGLCGLVQSKHATVAEPTKLRSLGAIGDTQGRALRLRFADYASFGNDAGMGVAHQARSGHHDFVVLHHPVRARLARDSRTDQIDFRWSDLVRSEEGGVEQEIDLCL